VYFYFGGEGAEKCSGCFEIVLEVILCVLCCQEFALQKSRRLRPQGYFFFFFFSSCFPFFFLFVFCCFYILGSLVAFVSPLSEDPPTRIYRYLAIDSFHAATVSAAICLKYLASSALTPEGT